ARGAAVTATSKAAAKGTRRMNWTSHPDGLGAARSAQLERLLATIPRFRQLADVHDQHFPLARPRQRKPLTERCALARSERQPIAEHHAGVAEHPTMVVVDCQESYGGPIRRDLGVDLVAHAVQPHFGFTLDVGGLLSMRPEQEQQERGGSRERDS